MVAHFNGVQTLILHLNLDLLAVSQTWLKSNISNDIINIPGYFFERVDRGQDISGEGVGIIIKSNIKYSLILSGKEIEQIWLKSIVL